MRKPPDPAAPLDWPPAVGNAHPPKTWRRATSLVLSWRRCKKKAETRRHGVMKLQRNAGKAPNFVAVIDQIESIG